MSDLSSLGWNARLEAAFADLNLSPDLRPARVTAARGERLELMGGAVGEARVTGRLLFNADEDALPAVGDWVAARPLDDLALIEHVLPRASVFTRRAAGRRARPQVVAANIDTVFVVVGLDHDFNPRRIERYLVALEGSGARIILVLNKLDLIEDPAAHLAQLAALDVPVRLTSAETAEGCQALRPDIHAGQTVALVGSSGVGKSSLINALLGEPRLATNAVRARDGRGCHTTTARALIPLPGGGLLLDTPGMRELGLWAGDDEGVFADIYALAQGCRFRDCGHVDEPGCAVLAAVASGALDAARLESQRKLSRELASAALRRDEAARRGAERARARLYRSVMKSQSERKGR
ncbi:ribosome small subunit-dependent GTPase A [Myxococcota bacterium]|nr:ribosome small subunit-dependent GTPase A [Myxococcota bacterium]MBU1429782.1 ribosome small subunit-dependent GTPase A [Myxococcota bacterium]MBU1900095.1 ribosome small subunit-dependent GTPase A [Myxococcota bacterium]